MKNISERITLAMLPVLMACILNGCENTIHGVGQDVIQSGKAISSAVASK